MDRTYVSEAFKSLKLLEEEEFSIDTNGLEDAKEFINADEHDETIDIIDPEAETEEELKDEYIGKVICECNVCHSLLYKNPSEVILSEDDEIANEGEECPWCYSTAGYKVVGMVSAFVQEEPIDEPIEEEPIDNLEAEDGIGAGGEEKPEEAEEVEEGLTEAWFNKENREDVEWFINHPDATKDDMAKSYGFDSYEDAQNQHSDVIDIIDDIFDHKEEILDKKTRDFYQNHPNWSNEEEVEEELTEDLNTVEVKTDEGEVEVTKDEAGKISIEIKEEKEEMIPEEPIEEPIISEPAESGEVIAPLEPEVQAEIEQNNEEQPEEIIPEEPIEEEPEDVDFDVDDFDEESFDELGEGYLKKVYENVNSFKTNSVKNEGNSLIVEGMIKFNSGNEKATKFVFEAAEATKEGNVKFLGENRHLSRGKKSFTLTGNIAENKFIAESFNYNYHAKDANGKAVRLYGTVKRAK